jgi:hypothetical protein
MIRTMLLACTLLIAAPISLAIAEPISTTTCDAPVKKDKTINGVVHHNCNMTRCKTTSCTGAGAINCSITTTDTYDCPAATAGGQRNIFTLRTLPLSIAPETPPPNRIFKQPVLKLNKSP